MSNPRKKSSSVVNTRKLTLAAMFAALAFVSAAIFRLSIIPSAPFLNYDVKDVITGLGALILGPAYGAMIAVVAALLEWLTVSDTGLIGFIMNSLSSCAFVCTAALIYSRKKTLVNAVLGLVCGVVVLVIVMLLWNYIVTPIYQGVPRNVIAAMLPTVFLPFNAIKGSLNASFVFLLYRPVIGMLRSAKLMPASAVKAKKKVPVVAIVGAVAIIITCVLVILSYKDII